jgi:hypothetical protein
VVLVVHIWVSKGVFGGAHFSEDPYYFNKNNDSGGAHGFENVHSRGDKF